MFKRKLNIAQIANIAESVPPKKYGGTERVIYTLTENLVKRGHKVTLFASGDSHTSGRLISIYPKSLREARVKNVYGTNTLNLLNIGYAYAKQSEFDIIHDHLGYLSLPTANLSKTPVVMTLHGSIGMEEKRIYENLANPYFVAISKTQSLSAPNLNYIGTVHNGLNMKHYPFSEKNGGFLLFVGRISYEKGTHIAIEVAQYLNLPLIIAAKLNKPTDGAEALLDTQYFKDYVEPHLSDQIVWIGEVDEKQRNELMSKALCLLHPVTWPEPFGLVLIESMACGCPVVAFNKGSIPEIVKHGKTGFIVEDISGMISAVTNISQITKRDCREHALKNFNDGKMTDEYERIYYRVLAKQSAAKRGFPQEVAYAHTLKKKI